MSASPVSQKTTLGYFSEIAKEGALGAIAGHCLGRLVCDSVREGELIKFLTVLNASTFVVQKILVIVTDVFMKSVYNMDKTTNPYSMILKDIAILPVSVFWGGVIGIGAMDVLALSLLPVLFTCIEGVAILMMLDGIGVVQYASLKLVLEGIKICIYNPVAKLFNYATNNS